MKKVLINQPFGLGDIIFIMPIVKKYIDDGYDVVFPVKDEYLEDASIQRNFPDVLFIKLSDLPEYDHYDKIRKCIEDDKYIYLPLRYSNNLIVHPLHMGHKYTMAGLSYEMWRTVQIIRHPSIEEDLIKYLKIASNEKFNLINECYSHQAKIKTKRMYVKTNNNYRNIYMSSDENFKIKGINLFDWMGVIERAASIHTVHTSIQYLIDILPNTTSDLHIYSRYETREKHTKWNYLFKKRYVYH